MSVPELRCTDCGFPTELFGPMASLSFRIDEREPPRRGGRVGEDFRVVGLCPWCSSTAPETHQLMYRDEERQISEVLTA